jgi:antitoxin (DNA-binding transcriptional repressor) of toxin-antitoxin stability system
MTEHNGSGGTAGVGKFARRDRAGYDSFDPYEVEMMTTVSPHDVTTGFSSILGRLERGEEFVVADRGKAVARIIPPAEPPTATPGRDVVRDMLAYRDRVGRTLGGLTPADLRAAGL